MIDLESNPIVPRLRARHGDDIQFETEPGLAAIRYPGRMKILVRKSVKGIVTTIDSFMIPRVSNVH